MENLQLAPAAGAGIGKLVADALLANPDFIPLMRDALLGGLEATTRHWDREAKQFEIEPDFKVRIQAFSMALAHMEGEPVKRIIHQHLGGDGQIDLGAALRDSPALQAAIERQLENARFKDRKRGKPAPRPAELVVED